MSYPTRTITCITGSDGPVGEEDVTATIIGPLAVHRALRAYAWSVTHERSGLLVVKVFGARKDATRVARALRDCGVIWDDVPTAFKDSREWAASASKEVHEAISAFGPTWWDGGYCVHVSAD